MTPHAIIQLTADAYRVKFHQVIGRSRKRHLVFARQVAMWLIKRAYPRMSYPQIGEIFKKDHGSVMHSIERVDAGFGENSYEEKTLAALKQQVKYKVVAREIEGKSILAFTDDPANNRLKLCELTVNKISPNGRYVCLSGEWHDIDHVQVVDVL